MAHDRGTPGLRPSREGGPGGLSQPGGLAPRRPAPAPRLRETYCYRCGTPWHPEDVCCAACGGSDQATEQARPTQAVTGDVATFPGPWELVPWPSQGTVVLFGGPGSGKSSLAAQLSPTLWLTKEQQPKPVGAMFRRLLPNAPMPLVAVVDSASDVARHLNSLSVGPIVVDSLTALGLTEGLAVAHEVVSWAQRRNDRALAICQVVKGDVIAGYNAIPHLFDAVAHVGADRQGVRALRISKSRWSPLGTQYWQFSAEGQISDPEFTAAYSVEGGPGSYWLHPFPLKGAVWSGLLASEMAEERLSPGCASAAISASYMPSGFLEPSDVRERRAFAEHHGLRWLDLRDLPAA